MYKKTISLLILAIVVVIFAPVANAQGGGGSGDMDRVLVELDRTDQVLERAREVIYSLMTPTGKVAFEEAKRIRDASWESFHARRYGQAMEQTKLARQLAERAITAGRSAEENHDLVQRKLEHAKGLLDRIRENAPEEIPQQFRALWRNAKENLQRAREFYRSGQNRPALKLCNQVEKAASKIIEAFRDRKQAEKRFQRRYDQVSNTIENHRAIIADCESERASEMLQKAFQFQEKAGELFAEGKVKGAGEMLQKAFRLANRAVEECRGEGEFLSRLERTQAIYEMLVGQVAPDDTRGQELLAQIREQLALANQAYESDNLDAANAALRAAKMKIKQLQKYLQMEQES